MYKEFSNIYETLIDEDFDYKKCHDFIIELVNKYEISKGSFLDSGCGTAKLSSLFKNEFNKITLLDSSEEMLILARDKFKLINQPIIIKGNSSSFKSNNKFDLIISTLDVPNYFRNTMEVGNYLKNSYDNLKNKGLLIFDISSIYKLDYMSNNIFNMDENDYFHSWENNKREEKEDTFLDITMNIFKKDTSHLYKRIIEEQTLLYIKDEIIQKKADELGFEIKTFDNYTNNNINEKTQRITYVLRKERLNG